MNPGGNAPPNFNPDAMTFFLVEGRIAFIPFQGVYWLNKKSTEELIKNLQAALDKLS